VSGPSTGDWTRTLAQAGASLELMVHGALESLGRARWGEPDAGHWRVLSTPDQATWALARFIGIDDEENYRYERIQVVATVDPHGDLVTWQVSNGTEFLGLTDLSAYGLQRGVVYLLDQEAREWVSPEPLFVEKESRRSGLLGLWHRLRGLVG
jgi:hypothetical protein